MPDWRQLSLADQAAWVIGTGFGTGFSPIAPGTVGSLASAVILYGLSLLLSFGLVAVIFAALLIVAGLVVGVWATGRMSTAAEPDPGTAVWDEFVGMWISALPLGSAFGIGTGGGNEFVERWIAALPEVLFGWGCDIWWMLIAFLIFRALDVLKPWPCRRLERLHGGWGIMLDDVAAGLMTLVIVQLLSVGFALLLVWGPSQRLY